jgi:hypothetical protein
MEGKEHGLYVSSDAFSAAKKAVTKIKSRILYLRDYPIFK